MVIGGIMKGQTTILAVLLLFVFVIAMSTVGVPMILSVNTTGFDTWTTTLWALLIPFLFIAAILFMIYYSTPKHREYE